MGYIECAKKLGLLPPDFAATGSTNGVTNAAETANSTNSVPSTVQAKTVPIVPEGSPDEAGLDVPELNNNLLQKMKTADTITQQEYEIIMRTVSLHEEWVKIPLEKRPIVPQHPQYK